MRVAVRFRNGATADAVILATGRDRVRVIVAGRATTEEWLVLGGSLFDENGRGIEIDSVVAVAGIDYSQIGPQQSAAAGSFGVGVD